MDGSLERKERVVGSYVVGRLLGKGGNASVFEARSVSGTVVALKVLFRWKGDAYQRFKDEIAVLRRRLDGDDGVLPVLDAYLPEYPTPGDRPWLTMPVAVPISRALKDAPLEQVIAALREIAETLARLHRGSIHHRDIKPNNLYRHAEKYKVGDFGLVDFPGKAAITSDRRKLGSVHYHAPEMLSSPSGADGQPADVYSFCKTLWVLATKAKFPPDGEHRHAREVNRIASRVKHPRSEMLDHLVSRGTAYFPTERCKMSEIADELRSWLAWTGGKKPVLPDVGAQLKAIAATASPRKAREDELAAINLAWYRFARETVDHLHPIVTSLEGTEGTSVVRAAFANDLEWLPTDRLPPQHEGGSIAFIAPSRPVPTIMRSGLRVDLEDGTLKMKAIHSIQWGPASPNVVWSQTREAPLGSSLAEERRADLVAELVLSLGIGLRHFYESLQGQDQSKEES